MCIGLSSQMKLDTCPFKEDQNSMPVLPGGMGSKGKLTWWGGVWDWPKNAELWARRLEPCLFFPLQWCLVEAWGSPDFIPPVARAQARSSPHTAAPLSFCPSLQPQA